MRFRELETQLKNLPLFNLNDVRKLNPDFNRRQLYTWQLKDYIRPLIGGYYALEDRSLSESFMFLLSNQVYIPSYVSLESALEYYHVIPETVLGVTGVSSRKTKVFVSEWGEFSYRSIKSNLMFGYRIIEEASNLKFSMARIEKAVLDYLYLNSSISTIDDFNGLRWNKEILNTMIDKALFSRYLKIFNQDTLRQRVSVFKEYLHA